MPAVRPIGSALQLGPNGTALPRWPVWTLWATGPRRWPGPTPRPRPAHAGLPLADELGRVQALHPRRLPRRVPDRARCSAPSSARSSSRTTSATAAATACVACPFGVIEPARQRHRKNGGVAQKCTLCYDRLGEDQTPACAKACPTDSIQFGDLDELRGRGAGARGDAARATASARPGSTGRTPRTASAAPARSSCCSTSRRSTGCRRTRECRPPTCPTCSARPAWRDWRCSPWQPPRSSGDADDHEPARRRPTPGAVAGRATAPAPGRGASPRRGDDGPGRRVRELLRPERRQGAAVEP